MNPPDARSQVDPHALIHVGEGFIQKDDVGVAHKGPGQRHPLLVPARQFPGALFQQRGEIQHFRNGLHRLVHLESSGPQGKGDILVDAQAMIQRVRLKCQGYIPLSWGQIIDYLPVKEDFTPADVLEPGQHAQSGALPAARGAKNGQELPVVTGKPKISHARGAPGVDLPDVFTIDSAH